MRKTLTALLAASLLAAPMAASAAWALPSLDFCTLAKKLGVVWVRECGNP